MNFESVQVDLTQILGLVDDGDAFASQHMSMVTCSFTTTIVAPESEGFHLLLLVWGRRTLTLHLPRPLLRGMFGVTMGAGEGCLSLCSESQWVRERLVFGVRHTSFPCIVIGTMRNQASHKTRGNVQTTTAIVHVISVVHTRVDTRTRLLLSRCSRLTSGLANIWRERVTNKCEGHRLRANHIRLIV